MGQDGKWTARTTFSLTVYFSSFGINTDNCVFRTFIPAPPLLLHCVEYSRRLVDLQTGELSGPPERQIRDDIVLHSANLNLQLLRRVGAKHMLKADDGQRPVAMLYSILKHQSKHVTVSNH